MAHNVPRTGEFGSKTELVAMAARNGGVWHAANEAVGHESFADATDLLNKARMTGLTYRLREREIPMSDNGLPIEGYAEKFDIIRGPLADLNVPTERLMGTVAKGYEILQPYDLAEILNPLSKTWLPETGGLLADGGRMWMLFRIPEGDYFVADNPREKHVAFLLVSNDFTGKRGLLFKVVHMRVVCENTEMIALNEKGQTLSINHDANIEIKTRFVMELQAIVNRQLVDVRKETEMMFSRKISEEEVRALFNAAIPLPKGLKERKDGFFAEAVNSPNLQYVDATLIPVAREVAARQQISVVNDVQRRTERIDMMWAKFRAEGRENPYMADTLANAYNAVTFVTTHLTEGTRGSRVGQLVDPNSWRNTAQANARAFAMKLVK